MLEISNVDIVVNEYENELNCNCLKIRLSSVAVIKVLLKELNHHKFSDQGVSNCEY